MKTSRTALLPLLAAALLLVSCESSSTSSDDDGDGGSSGGGSSSKSCVISGKVGSQNCSSVGGSTSGYTKSDCEALEDAFADQRAAYSGSGTTYTCKATWK